MPVAPEHRKKTAFVTSYGLYQFKRMPFRLKGAPATFQRMMDWIVRELQPYTSAYIDNLVIFSETWEEHLEHLRVVLGRLQQAGLTIKLSKCQFGMDHCVYLGHVVGKGVVIPELSKLRAVEAFAVPETKTEVRAFLGMTGYYRRFIANYAEIASPLTDLVKKSAPNKVLWSDGCNSAFNTLKKLLCSSPVLSSPDFSREFILQTDASDRAVGAVLSQVNEIGEEHPVGYFSRKLLPREERYSTIEKECLAIKRGVEAFSVYLVGRDFVIQTDHRALQWLNSLKDSNSRLTRWSLTLQAYSFSVRHRPGTTNSNADALSRIPTT